MFSSFSLTPRESIVPMRRLPVQIDEFAKVWEKPHKIQSKNDILKNSRRNILRNKKEGINEH